MKRMLALLAALIFLTSSLTLAFAETPAYTVGICQLVQHSALDAAAQGFKEALTTLLGDQVAFNEQNASGDVAACISIVNAFIAEDVDLILADSTPSLQAAYAGTGEIPILGTAVTDFAAALDLDEWTGITGVNVSGTSDYASLEAQAALLTELFPDAREVALLYCSSEANSIYQIEGMAEILTANGLHCTRYAFTDTIDVSAVTETACQNSDVIFVPTDNIAASRVWAIRNVIEVEKVPVIGGDEGICAGCGTATLCVDYYDIGYAAGEMAYEILANGADVSSMPVQFAPEYAKVYNAELCELLGVTIPEGFEPSAADLKSPPVPRLNAFHRTGPLYTIFLRRNLV